MKFLIFSDYHHWKGHYPNTLDGLRTIMEEAHKQKVDFAVSCGDTCHNAPAVPQLDELFFSNAYGIPAFSCWGNHETEDVDSLEAVLKAYKMKDFYEYHDINGYRLIILDTNYYLDSDGNLHHERPRKFGEENGNRLGDPQVAWLEKAIDTSPYPCILFSHASFEKDCGACPDAPKVRDIIKKANLKNPGRVFMCCNGHYHRDNLCQTDGVLWFDVNATYNVEWSINHNLLFPEEFRQSARMAQNCCLTVDPLYAIVTVAENSITVDGAKSRYLYDASPQKLGWDDLANEFHRPCRPYISSGVFPRTH